MKVPAHRNISQALENISQALEKPLKPANLPGKFLKLFCSDIFLLSGLNISILISFLLREE